jgi:hypothetical protein
MQSTPARLSLPWQLTLVLCVTLLMSACAEPDVTVPRSPSPAGSRSVSVGGAGGRIVVMNDEWEFTNTGIERAPGGAVLLRNVVAFLAGPPPGRIRGLSNNFGLTDASLSNVLSSAGYTYTAGRTTGSISVAELRQYAAVFLDEDLFGSVPNQQVLIDYVRAGGRVMVLSGTGIFGSQEEAASWNGFLQAFGLRYNGGGYNGVSGVIPASGSSALFGGVGAFYQSNGQDVLLTGSDPHASIILTYNGHGLIGIYDGPSRDPSPVVARIAGALGDNGWYVSDVTVTWAARDPQIPVTFDCPPAVVTGDTPGTTISCVATASDGTTTESVVIQRDATPPVVWYGVHPATYTVDEIVSIDCSATDALSGIAGGCAGIDADAYTFAAGLNTISATALDNAGNRGGAFTTFTLVVSAQSMCTLTQRWVSTHGVANSLCAKLDAEDAARARGDGDAAAGLIMAYVNELHAQMGKTLSAENAATLERLAAAM